MPRPEPGQNCRDEASAATIAGTIAKFDGAQDGVAPPGAKVSDSPFMQ
jgi:hypothetical protein